MAGPHTQAVPEPAVRQPAVAGTFYPADPSQCRLQAQALVAAEQPPAFPQAWGAIVPHAGWICSGAIAGQAIAALARLRTEAQVVIVFGAVHTPAPLNIAALDSHQAWAEPAATTAVAAELRSTLAAVRRWFVVNDFFHRREHAVEVVLPLVQTAWPNARVLPVEIPPVAEAADIGRLTARAAIASGLHPVYLASSDLTHYGPAYQFTPAGVGESGLRWAMENDRRLLEIVTAMAPERILPEVAARRNACGPGAIAAMMAACQEHGATRALLLRHASSFEVLSALGPQRPDNAVGYAAVLIG